jgi:hypothetical protein
LVHNNKIPIAPPLLRFPTDFDEKLPLVVYLCGQKLLSEQIRIYFFQQRQLIF